MSKLSAQSVIDKQQIQDLINQLVIKAKQILKDAGKVALNQAWILLQTTVSSVIQTIELNGSNLTGSQKKEIAMNVVSSFYDNVFTVVELPFIPKFLQPLIQKYVKQILMILVSASIDAMVTTFRQVGVFSDPKTNINPQIDKQVNVSEK